MVAANQVDHADLSELLRQLRASPSTNLVIGNGGSSAAAGHVAEDYSKILGIPTTTLHCPQLMTCYANDYGWDNWMAEAIKAQGFGAGSVLICISVSGESKNIVNAATTAMSLDMRLACFTGGRPDNSLSRLPGLQFRVDHPNYNVVEIVHALWLLYLCDYEVHEQSR